MATKLTRFAGIDGSLATREECRWSKYRTAEDDIVLTALKLPAGRDKGQVVLRTTWPITVRRCFPTADFKFV